MMNVQTLSIVTGSMACQAKCPFCVSKMTPQNGVESKLPEVNWRNFHKAAKLANNWNVSTVILTGKGEPTLFPEQVSEFLSELDEYEFPLIELQTNGIKLAEWFNKTRTNLYPYSRLGQWYDLGLTMVNLSVVSQDPKLNEQIYTPGREYHDLEKLVKDIHDYGISVRLSCTMLDGYMSTPDQVRDFIEFAKKVGAEQVTLRPVAAPDDTENPGVAATTRNMMLSYNQTRSIESWLALNGTLLLRLPTGGCVYDVYGQNVCWTDCLTVHAEEGNFMRQLIFFPDGHLRYAWQHKGAVIF